MTSRHTTDVSVIQEDFKWMEYGEEQEAPTLTALTTQVRRRYARNVERYKNARANYFASLGKEDPRKVSIMSGLDTNTRLSIIAAAKYDTAVPPIPLDMAPKESKDFNQPLSRDRAANARFERLKNWIALTGEFEIEGTGERLIPTRDVLKSVEAPRFATLGVQPALADVFKRINDRLLDVFPGALQSDGREPGELFKEITKRKADFFRHPLIGKDDLLIGGNTWRDKIAARALVVPTTDRNFDGLKGLIWKTTIEAIKALGNRSEIENYHLSKTKKKARKPPKREGDKDHRNGKGGDGRGGGGKRKVRPETDARLLAQRAKDWNEGCIVCDAKLEDGCGGIAAGDGKYPIKFEWPSCKKANAVERKRSVPEWIGMMKRARPESRKKRRGDEDTNKNGRSEATKCWQFEKNGTCRFGDKCRFKH